MRRTNTILFILLLFFAVLVGCASQDSERASSSNDGQAEESQKEVENKEEEEPEPATEDFEEMVLALGHATADTEDSHSHQAALKFKEVVEELTDGKVVIEVHPNGALGGEREMTEAIQLGTLDLVLTSSGPLGNFAPKSNAFDFPFLFRDQEHAYKVLDGEIADEVNEQLEEAGLKVLAWAENGFRNLTNNVRPIVHPDDMKGIKIRTMENKVHLAAFQGYGASPTPMDFTELFTAMQQGVVDGEENPLAIIVPNKFYEVQKYLTLSSHIYSPLPLIIGKQKFDSFSPELQQIFLDAAAEMRDYERNFMAEMNDEFIQAAIDGGMEIVYPDEFDYEAFLEATQPVYEEYAEEYGEFHEKIMAVQ